MRPLGWRYESHRHALAARGISLRKYMARKPGYFMTIEKDKGPAMLASQEVKDVTKGLREEEAHAQRSRMREKFRAAEAEEKITAEKFEKFMEDDFKTLKIGRAHV